jgi:hypothetical protein
MHLAASRTLLLCICLVGCSSAAGAQSAGYVAGALFADIRQFGGMTSQSPLLSDTSRDATGLGGSARVGTWVHPRWSLEVGVDLSSKTSTTERGPVIAIFPPVPPLELKSSASFASVTTMVGFHSPEGRRVRLGYRAGFSFVRARYTTEFPNFLLPPLFDDSVFADIGAISALFPRLSSLTIAPTSLTTIRNSGALILGIEAAIDLTSAIAVVPELRASTFSTAETGPGLFLIRPGVVVRWKF